MKLLRTMRGCIALVCCYAAMTASANAQTPARPTVTVDFSKPVPVKNMSGFLLGIEKDQPTDELIKPLRPAMWRIGAAQFESIYPRLKALGVPRVTVMLYDDWLFDVSDNGVARPRPNRGAPDAELPGWEPYDRFVRRRLQLVKEKGWDPNAFVWEVANEPDFPIFLAQKATPEDREKYFRELYRHTVQLVRSTPGFENALVCGPSYQDFKNDKIKSFLDWCNAQTPKLEVNVLNWHSLPPNSWGYVGLKGDIETARSLAKNYPDLKIKEFHVNEVMGQGSFSNFPGDMVIGFDSLEKGGADAACKSCWEDPGFEYGTNGCYEGRLDGLLGYAPYYEKRSTWYLYQLYANGQPYRVASSTNDLNVAGLGSSRLVDNANSAQIVLGYIDRKTPLKTTVDVSMQGLKSLPFLQGKTSAKITVSRLANSHAAESPGPVKTRELLLPINADGSAQVSISDFVLHDAWVIAVTAPAIKN